MSSFVVGTSGGAVDLGTVTEKPLAFMSQLLPGGMINSIGRMDMFSGPEKSKNILKVVASLVTVAIITMTWMLLINGGIMWGRGYAPVSTAWSDNMFGLPKRKLKYKLKNALAIYKDAEAEYQASLKSDSNTSTDAKKAIKEVQQVAATMVIQLYKLANAKGWKVDPAVMNPKIIAQAMRGSQGMVGYGGAGGAARNVVTLFGQDSQGFGGGRRSSPEFENVPDYVLRMENRQEDAMNTYTYLKRSGGTSLSWPQYWSEVQRTQNYGYGSKGINDTGALGTDGQNSLGSVSQAERESARASRASLTARAMAGNQGLSNPDPYGSQGFQIPYGDVY
jgi:hypothetical protein